MLLETPWSDLTFVGIDIETTGAYPVGFEICEMAAIRWDAATGEFVDQFQTLIQPKEKMSEAVIAIHGITNEMTAQAPTIEKKITEFYNFIGNDIVIAHHAPFDMGFLTLEFEKARLPLPEAPALCSSLISRRLITEAENHKLQTLIKTLNLNAGTAHRALHDARACIEVFKKCLERIEKEKTLRDLIDFQGKQLDWRNYSLAALLKNKIIQTIINAIEKKKPLILEYTGGSLKGERQVIPQGIVRNPDGDFLAAAEPGQPHVKRFYLAKIKSAECG